MISYSVPLANPANRYDWLARGFFSRQAWFWLVAMALALALYWVGLRLCFPGYFAPLSPFHIDIYDYVGTGEKSFVTLLTKYPRPVAYCAMKVLSWGGVRGLLAGEIALTVWNALLTVALVRRVLGLRGDWQAAGTALYLLLLFAHPDFYFEHRHDLPATVSYLFLVLALLLWVRGTRVSMAGACLAMLLSAFAKETYFAAGLCLIAGWAITDGGRRWRHAGFFALTLAMQAASLAYTSHINSPFVNANADARATYHIDLSAGSVLRTYWFYVANLANPALAATALLGVAASWRAKRPVGMLLAFVLGALAVFATHAVLPNHMFEEYAWAAAPLFLVPVLVLFEAGPMARVAACLFGAAAMFSYAAHYRTPMSDYMVDQDRKGGPLVRSLPVLQRLPRPARVLVTGLMDPVIPWEVPDYVRAEFGGQIRWSVLFPRAVDFRRASPVVRYVAAEDVRLEDFDYLAIYAEEGNLLRLRRVDKIPAAERKNLPDLLVPGFAVLMAASRLGGSDPSLYTWCADRSLAWGFWGQAEACMDSARKAGAPNDAAFARLAAALAKRPAPGGGQASFAELEARPERVEADADGNGMTDIAWSVPKGVAFEIHVGTPDGVLFAQGTGAGHQMTDRWVREGTRFFLQDTTEGQPLTSKTTLASVTVHVVRK